MKHDVGQLTADIINVWEAALTAEYSQGKKILKRILPLPSLLPFPLYVDNWC